MDEATCICQNFGQMNIVAEVLLGRCSCRMHLATSGRQNFCQHEKDSCHW